MVCYRPLKGYRAATVNENGRRPIVFVKRDGFNDRPIDVPCGQCIGCRLEKSRQWAVRCLHEASLYEDNCFVTLTYDDEHLPNDGSLVVRDFQLFMKRVRKRVGSNVRFFHCGEYGERNGRPHYHACIFNFDFKDKKLFKRNNGFSLYTSDMLSELWGLGHCLIGDVTFESAAYVARYITKKITGDMAEGHYAGRKPEYITMSRRPGIGAGWFAKFAGDIVRRDKIVVNGVECSLPRYYDGLFAASGNSVAAHNKVVRVRKAKSNKGDNTDRRLRVKEKVQLAKVEFLKRALEDEI